MRVADEISAIINKFDLTKREGISDLERHIRRELTIYEIDHFAGYLHSGTFKSDAGWTRSHWGHIAKTEREDRAMASLWCRLMRDAHLSLGAAAVVEMQSARMQGRSFYTDEGDGPSLWDLTLDEIAKKIPGGLKDRIDRDLAPERAKRKQQSASIGGEVSKLNKTIAERDKTISEQDQIIAIQAAKIARLEA